MKRIISRAYTRTEYHGFTVPVGGWYGVDDRGPFAASGWANLGLSGYAEGGYAYVYRLRDGAWVPSWESGDAEGHTGLAVAPLICYEAQVVHEAEEL